MKNKVPKLRFPEFSSEWEKKKLNELGTVGRGKSKHRPRNDKILFGGNYPFIQTGDIKNAKLFLKEYSQTYSEEGFKQSKLWNKGTLCITIAANIAETCILGINACFPDSIIGINVYQNKGSVIFLKNYFDFLKREFEKLAEGLAQDNLNLEKLLSINFKIPSLSEQEKIANFLSSVDIKIEKLEKKKELLEKYKKGMMQKLFSQKLRFKDENGNDYPEWEEKRLEEVGEIVTGKTPSTDNESLWNGEIQFITPTDIKNSKYQLNSARTVKENSKVRVLPEKSIMYTCIASIGKMALSIFPCITNQQINTLIPIKQNNEYIYYALLKITPQIITTQSNTTLPIINKTEFSKFRIPLPSLPEQEKIANFLSSIDEKIELIEKELEKVKEFKKGLLQQMFV